MVDYMRVREYAQEHTQVRQTRRAPVTGRSNLAGDVPVSCRLFNPPSSSLSTRLSASSPPPPPPLTAALREMVCCPGRSSNAPPLMPLTGPSSLATHSIARSDGM